MPPRPKKTTEPIAAAEAVKQARRQRWNPLRNLSPETLTRALDAFEYGDLREFALLGEVIADRDDTIKSVKPKREKATAGREWKVMKRDKSAEAEKHQDILQQFWQNVKAVNAYDRNERGGMGRLIKQMMSSVSYRYAAHHIVWDPKPGKLRATFEFVPLWFFENREGKLRFLKDGAGITGEELDAREWMVTCGDGLMIACAIDYIGKRYCMQDWLAFSEKFSMPGIMGSTSAAKGSPEGNAMKSAVESFSQDWSAVMYGVADPSKPPIHLIQPDGNPSAMPMPAYIERADRKIMTLYMGADLPTASSKDGQGTGASLQKDELDSLITDDCMTISETLQEVEREVLRWHFGEDVEPLAYIEVQPPVRVDKKFILEAIKILTDMGVRLPVVEVLESLGFSEADDTDTALTDLLAKIKAPLPTEEKKEPAANALQRFGSFKDFVRAVRPGETWPSDPLDALQAALRSDLQPLGDALAGALQAGDLVAMQAALRKISESMPDFMESAELEALLNDELVAAWLGEDLPVETNGDLPGHPFRGNQWKKWGAERTAAEIQKGTAAAGMVLATHQNQLDAFEHPDLGMIDFRWGTPKGGIQHVLEKHGAETVRQLPQMILQGTVRRATKRVYVEAEEYTVLLANDWLNSPANHWVITGYMHHEKEAGETGAG